MTIRRTAIASVVAVAAALGALCASAVATAPHWTIISQPAPSYFHAGDKGDFYEVIAVNDGSAATSGEITITDTLPTGVTATAVFARAQQPETPHSAINGEMSCPTAPLTGTVTCTTENTVPAGKIVVMKIDVEVPEGASGNLANSVTVAGGGAPPATASNSTPLVAPSQTVPYGVSLVSDITGAGGELDTQAGSHPLAFTTLLAFSVGSVVTSGEGSECELGGLPTPSCAQPGPEAKDVEVALPAGMVGNPTAVPLCSQAAFHRNTFRGCPADTQVGAAYLFFYGPGSHMQYSPIYNVEPPEGQPAELGFSVSLFGHEPMFFHVRSDGDYGLTADVSNITEQDPVRAAAFTIWGVPAAEVHNELREAQDNCDPFLGCPSGLAPKPFLRLPTSCSGSLTLPLASDSWQSPEAQPATVATAPVPAMMGCESLSLEPQFTVVPSSDQAAAPAGYAVHLKVPQNEAPEGLSTPDVRDVEVAMPDGTAISPSSANGLVACTEAQFGAHNSSAGECPAQAKIATVRVATPLLEKPLTGSLYVGSPECAPCSPEQSESGQLVKLLLEAKGSGVVVKLIGHTRINQTSGRLTAVFTENPQLPFEDLEVSVEGGPDAPLVNPSECGPAAAAARLTPWSSTNAVSTPAPAFPTSGCAPAAFTPSLRAGATDSAQAGRFTGLSVTIARPDGQQDLRTVSVATPPGLLGRLAGAELCGSTQAESGTCPADTEIGSASVTLGPGSLPLTIGGGRVYLTGPYAGSPFGLAVVVPAQAGPFTLQGTTGLGTVVVRAAISVDPHSAALTVSSAAIPRQLNGIPLRVQSVTANVNRPNFLFNPTSCDPLRIGAVVTSYAGGSANPSTPFQATDCAALPFEPSFTASTQAKTSRIGGASLTVKVKQAPGEANIHKVDLQLPKVLPSRLSTLRKACSEAQFNANPAGCPAESAIGTGTAVTPVLRAPLRGPAYLVSHGNAAFPDVEYVLQADERGGVLEIVLDGTTQIKGGITYSHFETVPDAPIDSFETTLPEGPHAVFTTLDPGRTNLCAQKLALPLTLAGQNGALVRREPRIEVTGCRYALTVSSHAIRRGALMLHVVVPAAGTLSASGHGLRTTSRSAGGRETLALAVKQTRAGAQSRSVTLRFRAITGKRLARSLRVRF